MAQWCSDGWGLCAGRSEILKHSAVSAGEEYQLLCLRNAVCVFDWIQRNKSCINTPPSWRFLSSSRAAPYPPLVCIQQQRRHHPETKARRDETSSLTRWSHKNISRKTWSERRLLWALCRCWSTGAGSCLLIMTWEREKKVGPEGETGLVLLWLTQNTSATAAVVFRVSWESPRIKVAVVTLIIVTVFVPFPGWRTNTRPLYPSSIRPSVLSFSPLILLF